MLEISGHEVEIWIFNPKNHKTADEAYEDIVRHYYLIASKVHLLDEGFHENAVGDVIFATSWDTVWPVQSTVNFKRRMYFVQDFEPLFSPTGTKSELARLTYTKDLDCICASRWLDKIMREQFGRCSNYFNLAEDYSLLYPKQKTKNDVPKIVLYARYFTERRAVELALIALEMLADEGEVFHVDMYGANFPVKKTPYSCNIYDKQTPEQLAELYREADVGIVFSLTNYSLVPQEMMACGLPIIEFDTESTRAIYPNDAVVFAGPHPEDIKEKLKSLLHNPERRVAQSEAALNWVKQFSWPGAANRVEQSIIERLSELGYRDTTDSDSASSKDVIKASIIIPTCNGGEIFKKVLKKVLAQRAPWEYEVIVLDSESTDGTVEVIQSHQDVIYKKIKRVNFNHGGTRNYGVSIAKGEFVAFLTQDALPTSEFWLYDLVTMLERFPNAAGVFGKHVAHDDATFFTRKELEEHFGRFATLPLVLSSDRKRPENIGVEEWKNLLHFYSDNNSCLRKSIWKKLPYPEVQYGEDQLWADAIIKAGFTKLYCPTAVVKHSHDYEPEDVYERAKIDADFFKYHWGYKLVSADGLSGVIKSINESETLLGLEMGLSDLEIKERNKVVEMKFKGYCDGVQKKVSLFSESSSEKSRF
ncbi:MAG: glycosyltransferase [Pseudomonadota bacterium]|nr:glycosyltransferase [Pseudomonadota bacterium]